LVGLRWIQPKITVRGTAVSKNYQRRTRRTQAAAPEAADAATNAGVAMPEHVQVAMAEIAGSVRESLLALAVGRACR
jgi:hypothetical protein